VIVRALFFGLLLSSPAAAQPATLARPHDAVILSTARLAALPGRRVDALRLAMVTAPLGVDVTTLPAPVAVALGP
jgi:hypothetical protein